MRTQGWTAAALAVVLGAGTAGAVPWPGDDTGSLTADKAASKCEQKASKNVGKLVGAILKCQTKLVDAAFKGKPFDEQACESAAQSAFLAKTVTADCACVDTAGIIAIAEPVVNSNTVLSYCDPAGSPIAGLPDNGAAQISGNIPTTIEILKYEDKVGKSLSKLVASFLKCHQQFAAAYQKAPGTPDDSIEESCEAAAISAFQTSVGLLTGGQGCEDINGLIALTRAQLDGANFLTFCASPSGAFIQ